MRKISTFTSLIILASTLMIPQAGAANAKSGATCTKAGAVSTVANVKFTCIKSGKKLIWNKGVKVVLKSTPTSTPTPTTTINPASNSDMYIAKDQETVRKLYAKEGCSNPSNTSFVVQVKSDLLWLPVKPLDSGWIQAQGCSNPALGKKNSLAWVNVHMDAGTTYRWLFTGEVNIERRDGNGNGVSAEITLPASATVLTPHPVDGRFGITWDNALAKFNDIAAAAWTDGQATILRNANLPNASGGYKSYFSASSLVDDPKIREVETYLNRTFSLFARFPAPKTIIFVATTQSERLETKKQMDTLYADNEWMKRILDEMYGINTNTTFGSDLIKTTCSANDTKRAGPAYPDARVAGILIIDICPAIGTHDPHQNGVHQMVHEYVHLIQAAVLINVLDRSKFEPCWLREGGPEWVQAMASGSFTEYLSAKNLLPVYQSTTHLQRQITTARVWTTEEVAGILSRQNDPATCGATNDTEFGLSPSLGTAAVETLVSIGGSESFLALQQRLANGESSNQAFTKVYGKSWDEILPTLAAVVARQITKSWDADALTYQTRP